MEQADVGLTVGELDRIESDKGGGVRGHPIQPQGID